VLCAISDACDGLADWLNNVFVLSPKDDRPILCCCSCCADCVPFCGKRIYGETTTSGILWWRGGVRRLQGAVARPKRRHLAIALAFFGVRYEFICYSRLGFPVGLFATDGVAWSVGWSVSVDHVRPQLRRQNRLKQPRCRALCTSVQGTVCYMRIKMSSGRLRGTAVERRSSAGELSLSCARPAADGWPLMLVNHPL